jgi:hypothetical protein
MIMKRFFMNTFVVFLFLLQNFCFAQKDNPISDDGTGGKGVGGTEVCTIPCNIRFSYLSASSVSIVWDGVNRAGFEVAFRSNSATEWTKIITTTNTITLNELSERETYLLKIRQIDERGTETDFSREIEFGSRFVCPTPNNLRYEVKDSFTKLTFFSPLGITFISFDSSHVGSLIIVSWDEVPTLPDYQLTIINLNNGDVFKKTLFQDDSIHLSLTIDGSYKGEGYIVEVSSICGNGEISPPAVLEIGTNRCHENMDTRDPYPLNNVIRYIDYYSEFNYEPDLLQSDINAGEPQDIYNLIEAPHDTDSYHLFLPRLSLAANLEIISLYDKLSSSFFSLPYWFYRIRKFFERLPHDKKLVFTLSGMTKDYDLIIRNPIDNEIEYVSKKSGTQDEIIVISPFAYFFAYYRNPLNEDDWPSDKIECEARNSKIIQVVPKDGSTDYDPVNCYKLNAYCISDDWDCKKSQVKNLIISEITKNSMKVKWDRAYLVKKYHIEYKKDIDDGLPWIAISTTEDSVVLNNLSQGTQYKIRIKTICHLGGESEFLYEFQKTLGGCIDVYEPNNTPPQSTYLGNNNQVSGLIPVVSDVDYFQFVSPGSSSIINISLTDLPADYDVWLYDQLGNKLASSLNLGLKEELITYNSNYAGMYRVKVAPTGNQYNPNECYKLKYWTTPARLMNPSSGNSIDNANTISLYPNPNNGQFVLQYKAEIAKNSEINIIDVYGKLVKLLNLSLNEGLNTIDIDLGNLSNGVYFLTTKDDINLKQKFIISK